MPAVESALLQMLNCNTAFLVTKLLGIVFLCIRPVENEMEEYIAGISVLLLT